MSCLREDIVLTRSSAVNRDKKLNVVRPQLFQWKLILLEESRFAATMLQIRGWIPFFKPLVVDLKSGDLVEPSLAE
jgi:hypothetical protein